MSSQVKKHDNILLVKRLMEFLTGREVMGPRWPREIAPRTQPLPKLPEGPYHRTSKIAYHTRDLRREFPKTVVIGTNQTLLLGDGKESKPTTTATYPATTRYVYGHKTY